MQNGILVLIQGIKMREFNYLVAFMILGLSGCTSVDMTPPYDIAQETLHDHSEWQDYTVSRPASSLAEQGWRTKSAWSHPPAERGFEPIVEMPVERVDLNSSKVQGEVSINSNSSYQLKSQWAADNVPSILLGDFRRAAINAKKTGSASFVDDGSDQEFRFAKLWDSGKCASIEVLILSEGGKLPIKSRGTIEVCE